MSMVASGGSNPEGFITFQELENYVEKSLVPRLEKHFFIDSGTNERIVTVENAIVHQKDFHKQLVDQMKDILHHMDKRFEQVDKRFEQVEKRFEQIDRRFDQIDKRFVQVDKHFELVDKRFESFQKQMDVRFEQVDKRFNLMQWTVMTGFTLLSCLMAYSLFLQNS